MTNSKGSHAARRPASTLAALRSLVGRTSCDVAPAPCQRGAERRSRARPLGISHLGSGPVRRAVRRPTPHPSGARPPAVPKDLVPRHVAIVMDGNGRWAKERGLPRTRATSRASTRCSTSSRAAIEIGVKAISAYAFSTENWSRSPDEVKFLMGFNRDVIRRRRDEMHELGVRVRWAGRAPRLWKSVIKELQVAEELTRENDVLTLTMCVNYGGRAELADTARSIAREVAAGRLNPEKIDERTFARHLYVPEVSRRRPGLAHVGGAAALQLHALAGGVLRARLHRRAVARRRPARTCGRRSRSTPPGPPLRRRGLSCRPTDDARLRRRTMEPGLRASGSLGRACSGCCSPTSRDPGVLQGVFALLFVLDLTLRASAARRSSSARGRLAGLVAGPASACVLAVVVPWRAAAGVGGRRCCRCSTSPRSGCRRHGPGRRRRRHPRGGARRCGSARQFGRPRCRASRSSAATLLLALPGLLYLGRRPASTCPARC